MFSEDFDPGLDSSFDDEEKEWLEVDNPAVPRGQLCSGHCR